MSAQSETNDPPRGSLQGPRLSVRVPGAGGSVLHRDPPRRRDRLPRIPGDAPGEPGGGSRLLHQIPRAPTGRTASSSASCGRADLFLGEIRRSPRTACRGVDSPDRSQGRIGRSWKSPLISSPSSSGNAPKSNAACMKSSWHAATSRLPTRPLPAQRSSSKRLAETGPGTGADVELAKIQLAATRLLLERGKYGDAEAGFQKLIEQLSPLPAAHPADQRVKSDLESATSGWRLWCDVVRTPRPPLNSCATPPGSSPS